MCLNLYGCQVVLKKVVLVLKCIFSGLYNLTLKMRPYSTFQKHLYYLLHLNLKYKLIRNPNVVQVSHSLGYTKRSILWSQNWLSWPSQKGLQNKTKNTTKHICYCILCIQKCIHVLHTFRSEFILTKKVIQKDKKYIFLCI